MRTYAKKSDEEDHEKRPRDHQQLADVSVGVMSKFLKAETYNGQVPRLKPTQTA